MAQLGKYLPGSVWPVVAQMRAGRRFCPLPRQRVALAFLLTLGLSVLWGLVVGLLAIPALLEQEGPALALTVVLAVPLVLILLIPRVLNALLARGLRLLRRPGLERPFTGRDLVRGSIATLAFWAVFGGHVWLLAVGLDADPWRTLPVAIGGFAVAFSIGPLLVVLPAGAGVREAVLVLLLATVLRTPDATAVALTSRGLLMATDGVLALAGWLFPHRVLATLTTSEAGAPARHPSATVVGTVLEGNACCTIGRATCRTGLRRHAATSLAAACHRSRGSVPRSGHRGCEPVAAWPPLRPASSR